jgi:hypothetical protein
MSVMNVAEEAIEGVEDVAIDVVHEVESVFKPRVGGKIDMARRNAEAYDLQDEPVAQQDTLGKGNKPFGVDVILPGVGIARTITLDVNNTVLPLLPRDTTRREAYVLAVDNPVYLAVDPNLANQAEGAATSAQAFYLPVNVPMPVPHTAEIWVSATTTATSSRVSVMSGYAGIR